MRITVLRLTFGIALLASGAMNGAPLDGGARMLLYVDNSLGDDISVIDLGTLKVVGDINIGLCFGLLQFVSTFTITMLYARWARRNTDPVAGRLRQRVERGRRR